MPVDLPWLKTYVDEWLLSEDNLDLTAEEVGALTLLQCWCWKHDATLPTDARKLATIARCPGGLPPAVAARLVEAPHAEDRLTLPDVYEQWQEFHRIRQRSVAAGKLGAARRWGNRRPSHSPPTAPLPVNDSPPIAPPRDSDRGAMPPPSENHAPPIAPLPKTDGGGNGKIKRLREREEIKREREKTPSRTCGQAREDDPREITSAARYQLGREILGAARQAGYQIVSRDEAEDLGVHLLIDYGKPAVDTVVSALRQSPKRTGRLPAYEAFAATVETGTPLPDGEPINTSASQSAMLSTGGRIGLVPDGGFVS